MFDKFRIYDRDGVRLKEGDLVILLPSKDSSGFAIPLLTVFWDPSRKAWGVLGASNCVGFYPLAVSRKEKHCKNVLLCTGINLMKVLRQYFPYKLFLPEGSSADVYNPDQEDRTFIKKALKGHLSDVLPEEVKEILR